MTTIRAYAPADRDAATRLRFAAFSDASFDPADPPTRPYIEDDRRVVAESDGDLVGHAAAWRMGQYFGGRRLAMAGVAGVTVTPEARGTGAASKMVTRLLHICREQGDVVSMLYPATLIPYRRLGWELAGEHAHRELRTRALLDLPRPEPSVATRRGRPSADAGAVHSIYDRAAPRHAGWLDRTDRLWQRVLADAAEDRADSATELHLVEREGAPTGYVLWSRQGEGDEALLDVHELVALDADSERALWRLLGTSWTVWPTTRFVALDETLLRLDLPETEISTRDDAHGWMLRVLHAEAAIAERGFPAGVRVEVAIHLADATVPRNSGPYTLRVEDGRGRLEPGGAGTVRIPIGAFSSLFAGWRSATQLRNADAMTCHDATALDALDAAFAGPVPTCPDDF